MNQRVLGTTGEQRRRRLLLAAVAASAALAGAGAALWRLRPHDEEAADPAAVGFWDMSFETPQGSSLSLASFKGQPLLVNFWATWCPPCVEEMPLLDAFYRQNAANGWQVLGLAVDQPASVRSFLQRTPISFPVGLAGTSGAQLSRSLGNLVGGLPFSLALDTYGRVRQRRMGQLTAEDLRQWARLV